MGNTERKFALGDRVRTVHGAPWVGTVCGSYSTDRTPEGYAVVNSVGAVHIYPASSLEKDSLSEAIEANANLTLWCVYVLGPDDVQAAPSYSAAVERAREINESVHGLKTGVRDILCFAYAAPWPHTAEGHKANLSEWDD